MPESRKVILFHSDAVPDDTFLVFAFDGFERISDLFRYELDLISTNQDADFTAILRGPAYLGIKVPVRLSDSSFGSRLVKIQGMICMIRQLEKRQEWTRYRAVLVPRLWRLSLGVTTRIFIEKSVPEMIEEILKEEGYSSGDYEFRCARGQPREFAVQYQESSLAFIQRWLEHEGIYYFFEEGEEGEKVVFADSTAGYVPAPGQSAVPYRPIEETGVQAAAEGLDEWFKEGLVRSFCANQVVVPARVILKDYNWRKPSEDLRVDQEVAADGMGTVFYYADHFKDKNEGKSLATARAGELKCRQKTFSGTSDHKSFGAGSFFALDGHYRSDFNAEYVLTEVRHHAEQALGLPWAGTSATVYTNEFEAILKSEVFRPERQTPWPSIHGLMHGRIDAGGDGKYAEIDDMGRYKVILPFDLSGRSGGKASRYVRMMQPYAGGGMGMHFPLHKGTEVFLAFLDGDPDRPVIVGAVPNPETASPVTGGNATQCKIQTGGGNSITIEDTDGSQQIRMVSPTKGTFLSLGAMNQPGNLHAGTDGDSALDTGGKATIKTKGDETRSTDGSSFWTVKGLHSEKFLGCKEELVVGAKTEQVLGVKNETITGAELVQVLAVICELGLAAKIEKVAGPHLFENPIQKQDAKILYIVNAGSMITLDAPTIFADGSTGATVKSGGSKVDVSPAGVEVKGPKVENEADGAAILKGATVVVNGKNEVGLNAGGSMEAEGGTILLKSKGALNQNAAEVHVDAGLFEVNGSTLEVTKSKVSAKGTTFSVE